MERNLVKIFKWESPYAKWLVGAFVAVFVAGFVNECRAERQLEFSGGYSSGYSWIVPAEAVAVEISTLPFDGKWDVSVGYIGDQYNGIEEYAYASGTRVVHFDVKDSPNLHPYVGLGLMVRQTSTGNSELLPSWWNFSLQFGFDYGDHWRVEGRHFSNAGTKEPNRGQNLVLVGYRF